jgi:hypothetical protein
MQSRQVTRLTLGGDGRAVPDRRQNAGMLAGVRPRLTSLCRQLVDFNRVRGGAGVVA